MMDQELARLALAARQNAYVPYSHYAVGAAVLTAEGLVFTGCNIENASYPAGCCAERTAVFQAVSTGARKLVAIALAAAPEGEEAPLCAFAAPCGICLQVLSEFSDGALRVLLVKSEAEYRVCTLSDLLPLRFTAEDLH